MRVRGLAGLVVAGLVLALGGAGCGGFLPGRGSGAGGTATIWVTKNRGATLVEQGTVPAGQTLMRGLRSLAPVETRYGGRFVQSIDGVSGDASAQRDWFWFVNGLLGNESAADYRLHAGDVAWWDYRDWGPDFSTEVVVGAFPEPFLHGYDGHARPAAVRYSPSLRAGARRIARLLRARSVAPLGTPVAADANELELVVGKPRFAAVLRKPGTGPKGAVVFTFAGPIPELLPGGPRPYLRRFSLP
jgi:hypothetical protein